MTKVKKQTKAKDFVEQKQFSTNRIVKTKNYAHQAKAKASKKVTFKLSENIEFSQSQSHEIQEKSFSNQGSQNDVRRNPDLRIRKLVVKLTRFRLENTRKQDENDKDNICETSRTSESKSSVSEKQDEVGLRKKLIVNIEENQMPTYRTGRSVGVTSTPLMEKCYMRMTNNAIGEKKNLSFESTSPIAFPVPIIDAKKRLALQKLSLRKNLSPFKSFVNEKDADITTFNPPRNSTIIDLCKDKEPGTKEHLLEENKENEKHEQVGTKRNDNRDNILANEGNKKSGDKPLKTLSIDKSNSSLTNKPHVIEEILNSIDDDGEIEHVNGDIEDVNANHVENRKKPHDIVESTSNACKSYRFFHRSANNNTTTNSSTTNFLSPKKVQTTRGQSLRSSKNKTVFSSPSRKSAVYDFLSQSQSSDSDQDRAKKASKDVINKLIESGKALVAVRRKGKTFLVRKVKTAKKANQGKQKTKISKTRNVEKPKTRTVGLEKQQQKQTLNDKEGGPEDENESDNEELPRPPPSPFYDLNENDFNVLAHGEDEEGDSDRADLTKLDQNPEGTFSALAKSVLLHQTEQKSITKQKQLLEAARKIVATPSNLESGSSISINIPGTLQTTKLSPIVKQTNKTTFLNSMPTESHQDNILAKASPWRVVNNTTLPRTFHFGMSSSHLPSYSSAYIPATPSKPKKYVNKFASLGRTSPLRDLDDNPIEENSTKVTSSFSSNDSNAENLPPPSVNADISSIAQQNENIFNSRHLPNPRRTLQNRSPLKPINIQDVLVLPNWKPSVKETNVSSEKPNHIMSENASKKTRSNTRKKSSNSNNEDELFGFKDYIEDCSSPEISKSKQQTSFNRTLNSSKNPNQSLHEKLSALKKWRPTDLDLKKQNNLNKINRDIFDDENPNKKQRRINEMLCSTMINSTNSKNLAFNKPKSNEQMEKDPFRLFEDPELSFNHEEPHRTYLKPPKRKRKMRHNFVMFMDSDISEDDLEEDDKNLDDSITEGKHKKSKASKNKKFRKDNEYDSQLKEFVTSFNEMCKEVEQYELVVEKST